MKALLQIAAWLLLAVDVASAVMLHWTADSPAQDAAGRGMAEGLLGVTVGAIVVSALILIASYWSPSRLPALAALVIAAAAAIRLVLPALL